MGSIVADFGWGMPPGHPTGVDRGEVVYTCKNEDCEYDHYIDYEYDRSVNAFELIDPPAKCEECGRVIPDEELSDLAEAD